MVADLGDGLNGANGGPVRHVPVLLDEVLAALGPLAGSAVLDGTFGAGGYSRALVDRGARVIALDRDPDAIAAGAALVARSNGRLELVEARFSDLAAHAPAEGLDGVVLDIGVSSMQIDTAERGFSFQRVGPLDMRMGRNGPTAADIVNRLKAGDLARIFGILGEERHAGRIARAIEKRRAEAPFETTADLARLIETVAPRRPTDRIHPATRVFQALRIYVNDELGELARALLAAERALKTGGRLVVVTFHSLEDRIVKRFLKDRSGHSATSRHLPQAKARAATFEPIGRSVITAGAAEAEANPRARSAKLRAARRTDAPAGPDAIDIFGLPRLAAFGPIGG